MTIYAVTFCTMDQEAEANPLWHTCLLLSRFDEQSRKMEVVDNWGFYGIPTTGGNSYLRRAKIQVGLDIDLTGNHGMLRHEEIRFLDLGRGLHGVTFELTEEKFNALQVKCKKTAADQIEAINEIAEKLKLEKKDSADTRIYSYEHRSVEIFEEENKLAAAEARLPRLRPFNLNLFNPSEMNSCKGQVLKLLENIITPAQIARLVGGHRGISRFSGKTERIYLHSSGPLCEHVKRSGDVVHYRDGENIEVKLHWTLPPQEMETLSGETRALFQVHQDHCDEVKQVVCRLQRLEWLFLNAKIDEQYESYKQQLLDTIKAYYTIFATITPKKIETPKTGLPSSVLWLFSQPRDENEKKLLTHLTGAKKLFEDLYAAVVDNWTFDHRDDVETERLTVDSDVDLEALAAYLKPAAQKELCAILGRAYVQHDDQKKLKIN